MTRLFITISLLFGLTIKLFPQSSISGNIVDENRTPVSYAPVVLLQPSDSVMAFFGITNEKGYFEIKGIKNGTYLLQVSFIGQQTVYRKVIIPLPSGPSTDTITMYPKPLSLGDVVVTEEYTPMRFRNDTVEFNAAAFKTKPDAVAEDLIKKLPGMEVDRAGNIKAMGEDVERVLVDGKEFFGNNTKLATRNIPADALKRIQVYDKRSDESEFTGIDDGNRDKTINLLLKEDKKDAYFGDLLAGGGTGGYFQGSGKVYKFTNKNQFAALGMLNNINQFGFSFKDYIDFTGGLQSSGGHDEAVELRLPSGGGSRFPVNFGEPITGLSTSGAGGLNYSRIFKKNSRIFISYIANGSDRDLVQASYNENFTDVNSYLQKDTLNEKKRDFAQRINFGLRNRIDSTQNIIINVSAAKTGGKLFRSQNLSLFNNESARNSLSTKKRENGSQLSGNVSGTYLKIIDRGKTVLRFSSDAFFVRDLGNRLTDNIIQSFDPKSLYLNTQLQYNISDLSNLSAKSSLTRKLGTYFYLEPELEGGIQSESLNRTQGNSDIGSEKIDSMSPYFTRKYEWFRPGLRLIRNSVKTQLTANFQLELEKTTNSLNNDQLKEDERIYFIPGFSWEYQYKTGRRLRVNYMSGVNVPVINQLLPVINNSNPLITNTGNRNLKPECSNSLLLDWWIFDQFSYTSFMTALNATYVRDKINWDRKVDENLNQSMSLINVSGDYRIRSNSDFSTPIKKLGIKIHANLEETFNRGLSYVNGIENVNTNFTQRVSLNIENRNKIKWDINVGGTFQVTDANFSIRKSLNSTYIDFSYFAEMRYNPDKKWNFQFTTDITNYKSGSFSKAIIVPLMGAEISYYFLKSRGSVTFQGIDLLNRNTGIERTSELNFLREQRSNMLGRLFMFSFKYRLNKFAGNETRIIVSQNPG